MKNAVDACTSPGHKPLREEAMSEITGKSMRVLVVDDNRDAAITLGILLTACGFNVETSFDGEEALATAEQFQPDACVLDINMPGMDGYELARRLRERSPQSTPILAAVTGQDDYDHLEQEANAGFDLHFTKPADPVDLADQLEFAAR
jgi:two-component system OmpR family response regulator